MNFFYKMAWSNFLKISQKITGIYIYVIKNFGLDLLSTFLVLAVSDGLSTSDLHGLLWHQNFYFSLIHCFSVLKLLLNRCQDQLIVKIKFQVVFFHNFGPFSNSFYFNQIWKKLPKIEKYQIHLNLYQNVLLHFVY